MARQLRLEYAGAIYHVMNRGDRQEAIFLDAEDRRRFLIKGSVPHIDIFLNSERCLRWQGN